MARAGMGGHAGTNDYHSGDQYYRPVFHAEEDMKKGFRFQVTGYRFQVKNRELETCNLKPETYNLQPF